MKNILGIVLVIAALIILLPIVLKLTFSILALGFKIVFFIVVVAVIWYLVRRLLRLL